MKELRKARQLAFEEMEEQAKALGANAVVGIDIDYETVGKDSSMLMVSVSGTAVKRSDRTRLAAAVGAAAMWMRHIGPGTAPGLQRRYAARRVGRKAARKEHRYSLYRRGVFHLAGDADG